MPRILSDSDIQDFRHKLCAVAVGQFARNGYDNVSMRSLAEELGCSRTTPYRYYRDKAEILSAIRADGFKRLIDGIETALDAPLDAVGKLQALATVYFDFAIQNVDLYGLMFEITQADEREYPELAVQLDRLHGMMEGAARVGVEAGVVHVESELATQLFWAGMHGVISLYLSRRLKVEGDFGSVSAAMVEVLYRGLTRPG